MIAEILTLMPKRFQYYAPEKSGLYIYECKDTQGSFIPFNTMED